MVRGGGRLWWGWGGVVEGQAVFKTCFNYGLGAGGGSCSGVGSRQVRVGVKLLFKTGFNHGLGNLLGAGCLTPLSTMCRDPVHGAPFAVTGEKCMLDNELARDSAGQLGIAEERMAPLQLVELEDRRLNAFYCPVNNECMACNDSDAPLDRAIILLHGERLVFSRFLLYHVAVWWSLVKVRRLVPFGMHPSNRSTPPKGIAGNTKQPSLVVRVGQHVLLLFGPVLKKRPIRFCVRAGPLLICLRKPQQEITTVCCHDSKRTNQTNRSGRRAKTFDLVVKGKGGFFTRQGRQAVPPFPILTNKNATGV